MATTREETAAGLRTLGAVRAPSELLDRGTPDLLSTDDLPATLAAEVDYLAGRAASWTRERPEVHWGVRARALVVGGDAAGARRLLAERVAGDGGDGPAGPDRRPVGTGVRGDRIGDDGSGWTPQGLVAASWAASRVAEPPVVTALERHAAALGDGFVLDGTVPLAPAPQVRGLLAAARGDLDPALDHLDAAVELGDARAPVWGAVARVERARVMRSRALVDGSSRADVELRGVLISARAFFAAGGFAHLDRVAAAVVEDEPAHGLASPGLGHMVAGPRWVVGFGVAPPVAVDASKGLVALRHLVRNRHRGVPAVEVEQVLEGDEEAGAALAAVLDADALRAFGADGERGADPLAGLREQLLDDRARSRVSKLLRRTIVRLGDVHPLLAAHLDARVGTGHVCRYDGDGVVWRT